MYKRRKDTVITVSQPFSVHSGQEYLHGTLNKLLKRLQSRAASQDSNSRDKPFNCPDLRLSAL